MGLIQWLLRRLNPPKESIEHELNRYKEGNLTNDELQNLCHNLHLKNGDKIVCTRGNFIKGCHEYQDELFGLKKRLIISAHCLISDTYLLLKPTKEISINMIERFLNVDKEYRIVIEEI